MSSARITPVRPTIRRAFATASVSALLLAAGPAFAQGAAVSVSGIASAPGAGHATGDLQSTESPNQPAPIASPFGVPVVVTSPVAPPYDAAAAYSTYEGQSGFGPNAVLALSDGGAP